MRLRISPVIGLPFDLMRELSETQFRAFNIRRPIELVNEMAIQFFRCSTSAVLYAQPKTN
jgi:hypothetical protein